MLRFACALAAVLWAGASFAADKPQFGPPGAWVKPATIPASAPGDEQTAPARRVFSDLQVKLASDGDELFTEGAVRLQTPEGLAVGNVAVTWNPDTDTVTIHHVRILRGSEVIDVLAGGQTFTVLRRETDLERAVLSGVLTATLQPEGLQVGDTIDFAYTIRRHDPIMQGHSEMLTAVLPGPPTDRLRIREVWPNSKPVRWRQTPGLDTAKIIKGPNETELLIDGVNVERPKEPKGAPTRYSFLSIVELSEFADWGGVASIMTPLYVKAAALPPGSPVKAEAAKIAAASSDPEARAAAALRLVQDRIRYLFLGMNEGGYTPADADTTWARRFGDCKGKTVLLLALLHELGIEAEPALVSTTVGDGLDEQLPMVEMFNHVIVRARIGGKTYWMDGTRTGDRSLDELRIPPFGWALPLRASGSTLERLVVPPFDKPQAISRISLDASAGLDALAPAHIEIVFRGDSATVMRLALAKLSKTDLDKGLREYWTGKYNWIEIKQVSANFDPATGEERMVMDGAARMGWNLDADSGQREYETDGGGLGGAVDYDRDPGPYKDAPYAVDYPAYERSIETITLPQDGKGFSFVGEDVDKTVGGVEYKRSSHLDGRIFTMDSSARAVAREFPAGDAPAIKVALREMGAVTVYVHAPKDYKVTDAETALRLSRTPTVWREFLDRGDALADKGDYSKALQDFDRAVELKPGNAWVLNVRCFTRAESGKDLDLALKDCNASLELEPHDSATLDSRGFVHFRMGQLDDAIADFNAALKISPKLAPSLYVRGLAERRKGDRKSGNADVAAAKAIDAKVVDTYAKIGVDR